MSPRTRHAAGKRAGTYPAAIELSTQPKQLTCTTDFQYRNYYFITIDI